MGIREVIKERLPFLVYPLRRVIYFFKFGRGASAGKVFVKRYAAGGLGGNATRSGPGSDLEQTEVVRGVLPQLMKELHSASILDIPCGDFFWMKLITMDADYIGADIVPALVEENKKQYGSARRKFVVLDIIKDPLPKTDLILSRDCLFYLSNDDVLNSLRNIKRSGATYLFMTTFPEHSKNENIPTGAWRAINFELSPFNFPKPERIVNERCPVKGFEDKSLALWKVQDIPTL